MNNNFKFEVSGYEQKFKINKNLPSQSADRILTTTEISSYSHYLALARHFMNSKFLKCWNLSFLHNCNCIITLGESLLLAILIDIKN